MHRRLQPEFRMAFYTGSRRYSKSIIHESNHGKWEPKSKERLNNCVLVLIKNCSSEYMNKAVEHPTFYVFSLWPCYRTEVDRIDLMLQSLLFWGIIMVLHSKFKSYAVFVWKGVSKVRLLVDDFCRWHRVENNHFWFLFAEFMGLKRAWVDFSLIQSFSHISVIMQYSRKYSTIWRNNPEFCCSMYLLLTTNVLMSTAVVTTYLVANLGDGHCCYDKDVKTTV